MPECQGQGLHPLKIAVLNRFTAFYNNGVAVCRVKNFVPYFPIIKESFKRDNNRQLKRNSRERIRVDIGARRISKITEW